MTASSKLISAERDPLKRQIVLLNHALAIVNQCGLPPGVDAAAHWKMVSTLRDEIIALGRQINGP